jgi:hypothetical protein
MAPIRSAMLSMIVIAMSPRVADVANSFIAMLIERRRGVQRVHRNRGREFFAHRRLTHRLE